MIRFATWAPVIALSAAAFVPIARAQLTRPSSLHVGFYQPGVANLRDYATPPAGFYIIDYNIWTKSDGYYDRNRDRVDGFLRHDDAPQVQPGAAGRTADHHAVGFPAFQPGGGRAVR